MLRGTLPIFSLGEVLCALHHKVVEDHQKELTPGAVLVLRQVITYVDYDVCVCMCMCVCVYVCVNIPHINAHRNGVTV